ncbi:MAG: virulence-associated E family protein [Pseudomonadota bacterium]|nr:MAG: virulence-associated E family protein [Pseudomonadota bacterium]
MVARRHGFDPLADWLNSLEWDGSPRLESWLTVYMGAMPTKLNRAIARAFLISAVARALRPGCQADHVLCLESPQGVGKTETVRTLGGDWTQENLPDMHSKDGIAALSGAWFVELSELAAMSRSEVEAVKSFISRKVDKYRPAYGRHVVEQPRRCIFIATTNEGQYLRDRTGNRRFWPVKCGEIDIEALREDRGQLFAEAVACFKSGEQWHFTDPEIIRAAEAEQLARVEHDPWLSDIAAFVADKPQVTTAELLDMLQVPRGKASAPQAKRVAGIMRELGWIDRPEKTGGQREIVWRLKGE